MSGVESVESRLARLETTNDWQVKALERIEKAVNGWDNTCENKHKPLKTRVGMMEQVQTDLQAKHGLMTKLLGSTLIVLSGAVLYGFFQALFLK